VQNVLAVDDFAPEELTRASKKKVTRKKKTTARR
jgi:hypothetical protein